MAGEEEGGSLSQWLGKVCAGPQVRVEATGGTTLDRLVVSGQTCKPQRVHSGASKGPLARWKGAGLGTGAGRSCSWFLEAEGRS